MRIAAIFVAVAVSGCAGPNPNPGERTTDTAWLSGQYGRSVQVARPSAEAGEPWAQLRMGIFYENGWGVKKDAAKAEYWYKKVAAQEGRGNWADGLLVGATGRAGYFNQNSDAIIAQFNLAQLYYDAGANLVAAKGLIDGAIQNTTGESVFFCCEFAGGRSFSKQQFISLQKKIESKLEVK